jgi:hypothetical protein
VTHDQIKSYETNELRAELVISGENSKIYFAKLESEKDPLDQELGYQLTWHNPEGAQQCRVFVRRSANLRDQTAWEEYDSWLLAKLEDLHRVFAPRIRALSL